MIKKWGLAAGEKPNPKQDPGRQTAIGALEAREDLILCLSSMSFSKRRLEFIGHAGGTPAVPVGKVERFTPLRDSEHFSKVGLPHPANDTSRRGRHASKPL
jgi:hypothetical protein